MAFLIGAIVVVVIVVAVIWIDSRPAGPGGYVPGREEREETPEYLRAGILGEEEASDMIWSVLRPGEHLFTNVSIVYDDKPAELDNVVVNRYGVFIIEVKNYSGHLVGGENDFEWHKYKTTSTGNTYEKTVRNPIPQVRRQIWILARYLEYFGVRVWVRGYAILLRGNSPVQSEYILKDAAVDRAVHTAGRGTLDAETVEKIAELLA